MLQRRGRLTSPLDIGHAAVELPAMFYVFDLLALKDLDLRALPLTTRKQFMNDVVPRFGPLKALDHIEREGEAFMKSVTAMGLEGLIAKKADSKYSKGRSDHWLKIKAVATADFVIVGFTAPQKSRPHFGALQLADYMNGELVYAGRVGTGFDSRLLSEIKSILDGVIRNDPPCSGPILERGHDPLPSEQIPETSTTTWVDPLYVCEVCFAEWTPDGLLRHASFQRLRDDKRPHECERQRWSSLSVKEATPISPSAPSAASAASAASPAKTVQFSNLNKVFWPEDGYTKGDLIEYYRTISPWLLPYLKDRPVVLTRFPDGIEGKSFYQKDAPEFAPSWIRTVPIWSEDTQRNIRYFVCDDVESLEYIINMGAIPLHIWNSRVGSLELPDWCVIDLDPKEAPFSDVIKCALALKEICDSIGMPSFVKTTGKTGLHILLPLGRQFTYEQCRTIGELLARLVIKKVGNDVATITRQVTRRGDKVYLDYLQNRHGQLIVSPYSVRPLPGATVSIPLEWSEVNYELSPKAFTIKTATERLDRMSADPVIPVFTATADIHGVLGALAT
jgi:bifunctional non-homologous end joining protein LigD